jgi:ATP-binding cassette subfamily B multidrug efflux pump
VGQTGSGKTALTRLINRIFDTNGGRILIDGIDVRDWNLESLRSQISTIEQDIFLFSRTLAENIAFGHNEATQAEIEQAAREAQAHDFILSFNEGYQTEVGERGVTLSGGQRQRIAIARVLLKNAPILVLDEATSALDSEVEAAIQSQLQRLMDGKTVIAIAHRLSTIAAMDRLVVLDQGHVVEQGTHAQLLELDGHYAKLWQRQSGGFIDVELTEAAAE